MLLLFFLLVVFVEGTLRDNFPGRRRFVGKPHSLADYGLPKLHQIQKHEFSQSYSCGGSYNASALFLSTYSSNRNAPDLLYNGACGSDLYFEASTAGDDMSLLSDLGVFPLTNVTAMAAFNLKWQVGGDNKFFADVPVIQGHTYSALLSKSDIRALFAFTVVQLNQQTGALQLEYAVLMYEVMDVLAESPGWSWDTPNSPP